MDFQITSAGRTAAFNAGVAGIQIEIAKFKLGSAAGYTPVEADVALHGTVLHTGVPTGFAVIDEDTCEYTLIVNADVGTFDFGEVGLYLKNEDTVPFAIATLPRVQQKVARPGSGWNVINIRARIMLPGIAPIIQWTVENLTVGVIQELPNFSVLARPDVAPSNAYIVHEGDEYQNDAFVTRSHDGTWDVSTHQFPVVKAAQLSIQPGATGAQLNTNLPVPIESGFPSGRYLIQMKSGPLRGLVRKLTNVSSNTIQWSPAFGTSPAPGDQFEILQSNPSLVETQADEFSFFHALSLRSAA